MPIVMVYVLKETNQTTTTPLLPLNWYWVIKKKELLLFVGEAQLLVQPNVINLAELLQ